MITGILEKELFRKNIRPTAVRLRVLEQFRSNVAALSLNELEKKLGLADRSTLFRTLKTFEKKGIIHSVNQENGSIKYALCADSCTCSYTDHMHIHFSCLLCSKTFCLHEVRMPDIRFPQGFLPFDANVVVKGHCGSCSA